MKISCVLLSLCALRRRGGPSAVVFEISQIRDRRRETDVSEDLFVTALEHAQSTLLCRNRHVRVCVLHWRANVAAVRGGCE